MTEKEWIRKCKEGDEEAFEKLMGMYQQRIFFVCLKIVKDEGIAQDMKQETFVHAYQHLHSFRGDSKFYTWIYTIAKNLCLNYLRNTHRTVEFNENILYVPTSETSGDSEADNALLKQAINQLPKKQREVVELFEYQKIPTKIIAERLKIPEGTVRSRLHYARKRMKNILKSEDVN
jgi:RNA polymerase sigma-70 factor, ECF subfamily